LAGRKNKFIKVKFLFPIYSFYSKRRDKKRNIFYRLIKRIWIPVAGSTEYFLLTERTLRNIFYDLWELFARIYFHYFSSPSFHVNNKSIKLQLLTIFSKYTRFLLITFLKSTSNRINPPCMNNQYLLNWEIVMIKQIFWNQTFKLLLFM